MATVDEIYRCLDRAIDRSLSCSWDNDGLMVAGSPDCEVRSLLLALDATDRAVDYAINGGFDLILTHHPLIFSPISALNYQSPLGRKLIRLIEHKIAVLSFHTRLDALQGGVNDVLVERIGLRDARPFGTDGEMLGRIGLVEATTLDRFAEKVKKALAVDRLELVDSGRTVERVAVLGGAGKSDLSAAIAAGADTFLTGEMGHHANIDAAEAGINLVLAGHHGSEAPVMEKLARMVRTVDPAIRMEYFDSNPSRII